MDTVTLSSKGQLVIPKAVRDQSGATTGALFTVRYVDGEIRLKPVTPQQTTSIEDVAGCLARSGRKRLSDAKTKAAIQARLKARNAP